MENLKKSCESRKKLLEGISILNAIVLGAFILTNVSVEFVMINIFLLFLIDFILIPLNRDIRFKNLKDMTVVKKFSTRLIILLIFSISLYRVFFTNNYNLKYSYYIGFITLAIMIINSIYKAGKKRYKKRIKNKKNNNKLYIIAMIFSNIFLLVVFPLFLSKDHFRLYNELTLMDIKEPRYIEISKEENINPRNIEEIIALDSPIRVDSKKDILEIIYDLKSKEIENLQGVELLNYAKRKSDYRDQYLVRFDYGDLQQEEMSLEEGYIDSIRITTDGEVFLEENNYVNSFLFVYDIIGDDYPIELSKETIDIILSYTK